MCVGDAGEILAHAGERTVVIYCHTEKKKKIQEEIDLSHAINMHKESWCFLLPVKRLRMRFLQHLSKEAVKKNVV